MWALERGLFKSRSFSDPRLAQELFDVQFPNPLGLAAGFDKNGAALNFWHQQGFGFAEVGTVTFHAQPGNPRPRMFRLPEVKALINRLGFNNEGAEAMGARLQAARPKIPIGINLGKSQVTPLEEAAADYQQSYRLLCGFGDYFVVNVSSPNTPGLRSLQERGPLVEILTALREVADRPLFVKLSPDMELSALDEAIAVAHECRLTGLIATNTTISRSGLATDPGQEGGLSGRPLLESSNRALAHIYKSCGKNMVLMGVGGIFTAEDVYTKIRLGANLCQVYTGWVYGGPHMAADCMEGLVRLMDRDGVSNLSEIRGCDA